MEKIKNFNKFLESLSINTDGKLISLDRIVGKQFRATDDKVHSKLPFRIETEYLTFTPTKVEYGEKYGTNILYVEVPESNIDGSVSNPSPYNRKYTDEQALCMAITSFIAWNVLDDNEKEEYDVMVYHNIDFLNESDFDEEESLLEKKKSGIDTTLKNKSEDSGIPVGILRQVYNRGKAAWNSGHRPGTAQDQWAVGRVNSFITGSGGARKADADLWKKAKESKDKKKKKDKK